jgi:hypothetical protein
VRDAFVALACFLFVCGFVGAFFGCLTAAWWYDRMERKRRASPEPSFWDRVYDR